MPEPTPASAHSSRQEIRSGNKVLILGSSVADGLNSPEAQAVYAWGGLTPEVVTPAQWHDMTADQFMSYQAIIIGDAACQAGPDAYQVAIDTRATWGAIVDGDVAIVAGAPSSNGQIDLVNSAVSFVLNTVQYRTGMYIALGCAYNSAPPNTAVALLEPFGTFKVQGLSTCADNGHIFQMSNDVISRNMWDGLLVGNDGCSTGTVFTTYPDRTFSYVALAMNSDPSVPIPGQKVYSDFIYDYGNETPFVGTPYVLVRGAAPYGGGCGSPEWIPSGEECDQGDGINGAPASGGQLPSETCSWSCHNNWCGDGHVDTAFGEECDNGINNGRSADTSGTIGACTSFCKIPHIPSANHPPVAVCVNKTVSATNQCGMTADINGGSTDQDGDLVGCVQSPAGPYNIGNTTVTLTCTDKKNNSAVCSATVTVLDKVAPTVSLVAPVNQSVECTKGGTYTDPGYSASDMCSGELPQSSITKTGTVDVGTPKLYPLNYYATDSAGNKSPTVTRNVTVADTLAPVITAPAVSAVECALQGYTDTGVTANDQCEGDVTAKIVKTGSVTTTAVGDYKLTYTVSDTSGHTGQTTRTVPVRDTTKPAVTLNSPVSQTVECGGTYTDPGATASDLCAGALPTSVYSTTINMAVPGGYVINYKATDPSGNAGYSGDRSVTVADTLAPKLTLVGSANVPLECAATFNDPGATANDQCYGNLTSSIVRTGTLDNKLLNTPQTLTYNVKDAKNNAATPVTRTVTVSDTQAPSVTISGPPSQMVECGGAYTDPGATASDACAGVVAAVANPPANTNMPGNYSVKYTATDPSGNVGTSTGSRSVTVQDSLPPTLTLLGLTDSTLECGSTYTDPGATASDQCAGNLTATITKSGTVDNKTPSATPYKLHYVVSDNANHSVSADRKVTVQDTQPPTVTITGQTAVTVECGDGYTDQGATANDACVGALPAVATSTPNANATGNYSVTYTATDPYGNVGTSSGSRTVTVQDTQPPTISLNGAATMPLECGSPFNDPGATANDHCVGTLHVDVSGGVNNKVPNNYPLTYSADDGHGHVASTSRTVKVSDTQAPTITVNGPLSDSYECGSAYVDPGATASDACDLNPTVSSNKTGDPSKPGTVTYTYTATDHSGNSFTSLTTRQVQVNDHEKPMLVLNGSATETIECADPYTDPGAKANDACFGDISGSIKTTGSVNNKDPKTYQLTYSVTDPAGNVADAVNRMVTVADTKKPVVTINGPLNVPVECGDPAYQDQGATASDACAGVLPAVATSTANPSAPGNYIIGYQATDPSGNVGTSSASRTVTVSDTLPPTLALNGLTNSTLECGSTYTDPGATASDQCAGNLTATITKSGTVDNKTPSATPYKLTYVVNDGSGHSVSADRFVKVQDTLAPSITVNGPLSDSFECGSAYVDPGATASDACDLNPTVSSTKTGDPSKPGTITYTYTATDHSGNSFTSLTTREVKVNDHEKPTLALLGPSSQTIECADLYTDPGATATDACFGDISGSITTTGSVNNMAPNTYQVTYNVTDPAGNPASPLNRLVDVKDTRAPSITVLGPLSQSVQCGGGTYADPGATASDACAGDLTAAIVKTGSVNSHAAGSYSIKYSVADPSGNSVTSSDVRSVTVVDDLPPSIALNGSASPTLECGTPFSDPGATANDACAGNLTAQISKTGTVNEKVPAAYPLHYSVSDPSNHTVTVDRTVTVQDTLPPTLALNGSATQVVECGSSYLDPGATATDVCAGNLDAAVAVSGSVNAAAVGSYNLTYNVSDTAGHAAAAVTRAVQVKDTQKPTISVTGPLDQTFECGSTYMDPGATASDSCAGDLTAAIQVNRSGNTNQKGQFTITYSVTDPSGNSTTSPTVRTVHVNDNVAPTLALKGAALVNLECGTPFVDPGATAQDVCEGNLNASITVSGTVNTNGPRTTPYTLVYNVADSAGNSAPSVSRDVHVQDTQKPTLTVLGSTTTTYECGTTYTDPGATASDACAGNLTSAIVATQTPNPSQPANFTVTYSVTDPSGNTTVSPVARTVTMNDNQPPTISLNGPASQVLECSRSPYNDPGATATDTCVGSVPVSVSGSVNTRVAGHYVLGYSAHDTVGNTSPTVTRDVQITDTVGPAITVNGDIAVTVECKGTYADLGATAEDVCSGPAPVTTDNPVNTDATGFYLVKYHATDASGNTNEAVRNVNITDTQAPVISLNQPNPVQLECGSPYVDPGATALDACQGDVSSGVFVEFNGVDNHTEGSYIVKYQSRDKFGNTAHASRDVKVKDTTAPVLSVVGPATEEIECGVQPALGVTATDACYGDLTANIVATPATLPRVPGDYTVSYSVTDPAGNKTTNGASRHFTVVDTGTPVLSVNGYTDLYPEIHYECTGHAIGNVWSNPGATASDTCQGNLVVHQYNSGDDDGDGIPGDIDPDDFGPGPTTEVEGLYYVQYLAWDDSYNIQGAILSVYVQDTLKPVLYLNGPENVKTQCFLPTHDPTKPGNEVEVDPDPYVELGATGDDQCYGDVSPLVQVFGDVNKQSPGVYTLEYDVRDGAFNWADPLTRSVEVIDNLAPKLEQKPAIKAFPVDNSMRTVELSECTGYLWDLCEGYLDINQRAYDLQVTSNDPNMDPGDVVINNGKIQVRVRLNTNGTTRVYTLGYKADDSSFNTATGTCKVYVPVNPNETPPSFSSQADTLAGR
ncbi:MAG: immunoglobulin-like domain-containing protein [Hyalangium sp.]|uniref:immunoglobulin-like domain-containing protein n=1 Tax=Hyalangium sp. TaxID=2028555 RepID=UPI00389B3203